MSAEEMETMLDVANTLLGDLEDLISMGRCIGTAGDLDEDGVCRCLICEDAREARKWLEDYLN